MLFCGAVWNARQDLLVFSSKDNTRIRDVFEVATDWVVGTRNRAKEVAKLYVSDQAVFAPIETNGLKLTDKAANRKSKPKCGAVSSFPPPSGLYSSSLKSKKISSMACKKHREIPVTVASYYKCHQLQTPGLLQSSQKEMTSAVVAMEVVRSVSPS